MPLVSDESPVEGTEVHLTGTFSGERFGYYKLVLAVPVWYESVDGPDIVLVGAVISWRPRTDPLFSRGGKK